MGVMERVVREDVPSAEDLTSVSPGYVAEMGWPEEFACMSPGYVAEHYEELIWTLENRRMDSLSLVHNAIGWLNT